MLAQNSLFNSAGLKYNFSMHEKWSFALVGICAILWIIQSTWPFATLDVNQEEISTYQILQQYFKDRGFRSGNIKIPELQINIQLADHQFFKKEEEIEDIYDRLTEIRKEFRLEAPETQKVRSTGFCGVLRAECSGKDAQAYFILIKRDLNPESRIYTLGHEYGHFLWYLGQQELIYSRFNEPEMIKSTINSNKEFAILCSWTALKIAGVSLSRSVIKFSPDRETRERSAQIKELVNLHYRK
jgi:hypothetical protein